MVEIREIDAFLAVADEGGFTRAGRRLHLVQSAVSAAVARLESDLGVALFERLPRSVELTAEGRRFLPYAQSAMTTLRKGRDAVSSVAPGVAGNVIVGYVPSTELVDVPALVARFVQLHPQVNLSLKSAARGSQDLVEQLRAGHIDVAFATVRRDEVADLRITTIGSTALSFVCPRESSWASADRVRLSDLAHETFIDFPPGYGIRDEVDRVFTDAATTRNTSIEATHVHMIADMVASGLGFAFIPSNAIAGRTDLVARKVTGASPSLAITLATRRDETRSSVTELGRLAASTAGRKILMRRLARSGRADHDDS